MSVYWWFVVILLTAGVSMLGTAAVLGREPKVVPLEGYDPAGDMRRLIDGPQLGRAGYLPGPPFADPTYGGKVHDIHGGPGQNCWCGYTGHDPGPIPWDLAGAAYALGQQRADQDQVSREVDAIFAEVEHNPERWQR